MSDKNVTKEGVEVRPGQTWRYLENGTGERTRIVVSVENGNVMMLTKSRLGDLVNPTRVSVDRMHKSITGWELVDKPE